MLNEQKIGATGEYPDGQLNFADEGELAVAVVSDAASGRIILQFGKEIAWIAMTPEQAEGFGDLLRSKGATMRYRVPKAEKEEIMSGALETMFAQEKSAPVKFELSLPYAVGLIGQLQIAFRHPANTGSTREHIEKLVREWIEKLDPGHGDLHRLLMMGFDENHDE